ncbi:MAG: CCA tRNA nucleotidyltransferase [Terracidiphilus sp.]
MPDYVYLLENRLSSDRQNALRLLREAARELGVILFLVGDAVRDLTSGHAVRDLEVAVHGNALKFKKYLEKAGAKVWGEDEVSRSLYMCFPGTVRVDVVSTHRAEFPKPGKPVLHPASILEDLRRRDFTVNAMAISLNEGSFGLLMDPLNGVADLEARTLRLVSNYGFLEDPSLLIRATRYKARLGWELDPKTQIRFENAKAEGVIDFLPAQARSRELEQIGHEEEGLKILQALETEGWMQVLFPAWTAAGADEEKLKELHELALALLVQGVHADMSAAQMRLLTANLAPKEVTALKKLMLRHGFVEEWSSLDSIAASFQKTLLSKENAKPSVSFGLFTTYDPEAVLWLGFTSKDAAVQERYDRFLKVWPEARQRIPYALMQELRITPDLPVYSDLVQRIFLELIDGGLSTPEEMRAYLEPHSPPAPPPQVTIKRPRGRRGEARIKEQSFDEEEESEESASADEDSDGMGGDEDEIGLGMNLPKIALEPELGDEAEAEAAEEEFESAESEPGQEPAPAKEEPVPAKKESIAVPKATEPKRAQVASAPVPPAKAEARTGGKAAKVASATPATALKTAPAAVKQEPAKGKAASEGKKTAPAKDRKPVPAKTAAKAAKIPARPAAKAPVKAAAKKPAKKEPAKVAPKGKPAHAAPQKKKGKAPPAAKSSKPPAKKHAAKPAKKR